MELLDARTGEHVASLPPPHMQEYPAFVTALSRGCNPSHLVITYIGDETWFSTVRF